LSGAIFAYASDFWKAIFHSFVEKLPHARRHSCGLDRLLSVRGWPLRNFGPATAASLLTDLGHKGCCILHGSVVYVLMKIRRMEPNERGLLKFCPELEVSLEPRKIQAILFEGSMRTPARQR
jgi:hypothetical protein